MKEKIFLTSYQQLLFKEIKFSQSERNNLVIIFLKKTLAYLNIK